MFSEFNLGHDIIKEWKKHLSTSPPQLHGNKSFWGQVTSQTVALYLALHRSESKQNFFSDLNITLGMLDQS